MHGKCHSSIRASGVVVQILVTTSRDPSSKLSQFAKEVALVIPGAKSQNRGATVLAQLVESSRSAGISDIVVVHETRYALALVFYEQKREHQIKY